MVLFETSAGILCLHFEDAGLQPAEIIYVGDRLDNDVLPARDVGMKTAFLRRGPWGLIHSSRPEAAMADVQISSLADFPDQMFALGRCSDD